MARLDAKRALKSPKLSALLILMTCIFCSQVSAESSVCSQLDNDSAKKFEKLLDLNVFESLSDSGPNSFLSSPPQNIIYAINDRITISVKVILTEHTKKPPQARGPPLT